MLLLRQELPEKMDQFRTDLREGLAHYRAFAQLLSRVPAEYHDRLRFAEAEDSFTLAERAEVKAALDRFEVEEPDLYELAMGLPASARAA